MYPSQDDDIGGFFDDVGSAFKSVVKSPITKAVAGGLSFVVPPAGIAASVAIQSADTAITVAEAGKKAPAGSSLARWRAKVLAAMANTAREAKAGDPGAKKAITLLRSRKAALKRKGVLSAKKAQRLLKARSRKLRKVRKVSRRRLTKLQRCSAALKVAKKRILQLEQKHAPSGATTGILVANGRVHRGRWARL